MFWVSLKTTAVLKTQTDNVTKAHILHLAGVFCFPVFILKLYRMMCIQTAHYLMGYLRLLLHPPLAHQPIESESLISIILSFKHLWKIMYLYETFCVWYITPGYVSTNFYIELLDWCASLNWIGFKSSHLFFSMHFF